VTPYRYLFLFVLILSVSSCGTSKKKGTRSSSKHKAGKLSNKAIIEKYSQKMGGRVDNVHLYSFIDQWIGVPYKFGGKSRSGIDCSNFTCETLRSAFSFPANFYFPSSNLAEQGVKIESQEVREGDLVFFAINQSSKISHVGVYLMNNKFVHASTAKGVIISSLDEEYYKKRFVYFRRLNPN
jgi:hypothetical protein